MIRPLADGELDRIEPLWHALHAHHAEIGAEIAPLREVGESWQRRRAQYEAWLAAGDAELLVAVDGGLVGYAAVRLATGPVTWDVGPQTAELETLSVLPEARGSGVGRELVYAVRAWARARGASALFVGVAQTNDAALRFYAREGFGPYYAYLWQPLD